MRVYVCVSVSVYVFVYVSLATQPLMGLVRSNNECETLTLGLVCFRARRGTEPWRDDPRRASEHDEKLVLQSTTMKLVLQSTTPRL